MFSTTINYQWNQHQHNQTCASHHHHRHLYFLCKGCNKAYYLHQHRRQCILADFSGNCSCQFARDTWMAGASNLSFFLCQQSFVLYVCFPTHFSWTHWWRVWEQCRFSVVHLIMAAFYIFKKRSWCWRGWTKFMGWSCSSLSFVGLDFLPSFCKCSAPSTCLPRYAVMNSVACDATSVGRDGQWHYP